MLVTHDMATVQTLCDRAMLLHDGELRYLGDPEEAALRYYRLNFARRPAPTGRRRRPSVVDVNVRVVDAPRSATPAGERVENVEQGEPIGLDVVLEARRDRSTTPVFGFHVLNADGATVFGFDAPAATASRSPPGERVRIAGRIENPLLPGPLLVDCLRSRENARGGGMTMQVLRLLDFVVYGTRPGRGRRHGRAPTSSRCSRSRGR